MDAHRHIDAPGTPSRRHNGSRIEVKSVTRSAEAAAAADKIPHRYAVQAGARESPQFRACPQWDQGPDRKEYTSGTDSVLRQEGTRQRSVREASADTSHSHTRLRRPPACGKPATRKCHRHRRRQVGSTGPPGSLSPNHRPERNYRLRHCYRSPSSGRNRWRYRQEPPSTAASPRCSRFR